MNNPFIYVSPNTDNLILKAFNLGNRIKEKVEIHHKDGSVTQGYRYKNPDKNADKETMAMKLHGDLELYGIDPAIHQSLPAETVSSIDKALRTVEDKYKVVSNTGKLSLILNTKKGLPACHLAGYDQNTDAFMISYNQSYYSQPPERIIKQFKTDIKSGDRVEVSEENILSYDTLNSCGLLMQNHLYKSYLESNGIKPNTIEEQANEKFKFLKLTFDELSDIIKTDKVPDKDIPNFLRQLKKTEKTNSRTANFALYSGLFAEAFVSCTGGKPNALGRVMEKYLKEKLK